MAQVFVVEPHFGQVLVVDLELSGILLDLCGFRLSYMLVIVYKVSFVSIYSSGGFVGIDSNGCVVSRDNSGNILLFLKKQLPGPFRH